ncbi:MAG: type VI secretion protein IcmF/TssM N-terminal domain-containing protein [Thermodesulfobacteriota bacterium]
MTFVILSGIGAALFSIIFIKKYLVRKKEKRFISQIISSDTKTIEKQPESDKDGLKQIQKKWLESVDLLKKSKLKKKGNPLYILPWYLVIGESGTGKTTGIKNSRLSSPLTEVNKASGISGTRNFDWWFFDEAVILDTAGRYCVPVDEDQDTREWQNFLTLLCRYRKKEPINGLILTVSADQLLSRSGDELLETGKNLRKRTDQLMKGLGSKFPVYIMVTKTDLVHGMSDFSSALPEDLLFQAMGYSNTDENKRFDKFLEKAFATVLNRLKDLRLLIVQKNDDFKPGILILPDEFARMKTGLFYFLKGAFQENPYQENPMLRGLYFSSALSTGTFESSFAKKFIRHGKSNNNTQKNKTLFLTDFFKSVITKDRYAFYSLKEFKKWKSNVSVLFASAWLLAWLFICGSAGFSFWKNAEVLSFISKNFNPSSSYSEVSDSGSALVQLDSLRLKIHELEQKNKSFLLTFPSISHGKKAELNLKEFYSKNYSKLILAPVDKTLKRFAENTDHETDSKAAANTVEHLIKRIEILKKAENENIFSKIESKDFKTFELYKIYPDIRKSISFLFDKTYSVFIKWNTDKNYSQNSIDFLKNTLEKVLKNKSENLYWITEKDFETPAVYDTAYFYGFNENYFTDLFSLSSAFTENGKIEIDNFINNLNTIFESSDYIKSKTKNFYDWYEKIYPEKWLEFTNSFYQEESFLKTQSDYKKTAVNMTSVENNPYLKLLKTMNKETAFLKNRPAWLQTVSEICSASEIEPQDENNKKGLIDKLKNQGNKVVVKIDPGSAGKKERLLKLSALYHDYIKSLKELGIVYKSQKDAYKIAAQTFSADPEQNSGSSVFLDTAEKIYLLTKKADEDGDSQTAGKLLKGPLDFLFLYSAKQSECFLQSKWEETVLAPAQSIPDYKLHYALFNKDNGLITEFLSGPAQPFTGRNKNSFFATKILNHKVNFKNIFFEYITKESEKPLDIKSKYSIDLKTLPLDTNQDAQIKPYGCILNLACSDKKYVLENYNYFYEKTFTWSPDNCSDTSITILFKNFSIEKVYKGITGFPEFLKDFSGGIKTFTPKDFPKNYKYLEAKNIKEINISYDIKNGEEIIKLLDKKPEQIPLKITNCF